MASKLGFTDINGVRFYSTPSSCISNFENKSCFEKTISTIFSFGTLFTCALNRALNAMHNAEKQMDFYTKTSAINFSSRRLIVCLHGLNSSPIQFKKIIDEIIKKDTSESHIYIPRIRKKGNAKLDKIVSPILKDIAEWAKLGDEKELILIGISNGGRIARAIEAELINSGQIGKIKHFKFISIVGACKGSSLVNLAKKLHLSGLLSKHIAKEMAMDSERFKRLEIDYEEARKNTEIKRDYTFIASPHDWQVPKYKSTLMTMTNAEARYSIIPNHGHCSIVDSVAKSVATIAIEY